MPIFRKASDKPATIEINVFLMDHNGLGDRIAALPAIKYIIEDRPNIFYRVYCDDFMFDLVKHLLRNNINPLARNWVIKPRSKMTIATVHNKPGLLLANKHHNTLRTHIVDAPFHLLADYQPLIEEKNYLKLHSEYVDLSQFQLPSNYVVVTTGYTSPTREWKAKYINEVINGIVERGLTPLFLGTNDAKVTPVLGRFSNEIEYHKGVDLRNRTSLLESAAIMGQAKAVVGLDNGLLHLAATTDVPIVYGFTSVRPDHRLPYRHNQLGWRCAAITPENDLACRFCQSCSFINDHDYRSCFYKDYKCLEDMQGQKYLEALDDLLAEVDNG